MNQRLPAPAKALRATLLCAALVPLALVAACGGNKSGPSTTAVGAAGSTHVSSSAASTAKAGGSSGSGAAANASVACPSAAAIDAAAGGTYPAPQAQNADGDTTCNYADASTGANLNCVIAPATGITASILQQTIASQAQATGGKVKPLSGLGTAAYIFTGDDAGTNSDGIATSMIGALSSTLFVICGGELSPAGAEGVTRLVLAE